MKRAPARLRSAMERGFLNARCRDRDALVRAYGLWCWRMGLPMVWFEPRSPSSRLSRLHLEFFTTPACLSLRGRAALVALSARYVPARHASLSASAAVWDRVRPGETAVFAAAIFRMVRRTGNYEIPARPAATTLELVPSPVALSA